MPAAARAQIAPFVANDGRERAPSPIELSIVMPCLNEAETLAICIRKAQRFLEESGVSGEVIVADNGSTDGSRQIATGMGARLVGVSERGYGAALIGGIAAARGRYVVMGDADDSYDFANLMPFVEALRAGGQLVMGNRFKGGIAPGAMPERRAKSASRMAAIFCSMVNSRAGPFRAPAVPGRRWRGG